MAYQLRHFQHLFRKLARDEENPGNLKKMIVSVFVSMLIAFAYNNLRISGKSIKNYEEPLLLQTMFSLRGQVSRPDNIAIVKIDDKSYGKLGVSNRKPFPRKIFAEAIKKIQEDQPKIIIFDLHFPYEADEFEGTQKIVESFKLGPVAIGRAPIEGDLKNPYISDQKIRDVAALELPLVVDSFYRKTYYFRQSHSKPLPDDEGIPLLPAIKKYVKSEVDLPDNKALINFYGNGGTIRSYSMYELFEEPRMIPKDYFKDKVVFVGFASELAGRGFSDKEIIDVPVPGGEMYGVEIHATLAGNLIDKSWINKLSPELESLILFVMSAFIILVIILLNPKYSAIITLATLVVWFISLYVLFTFYNIFIPGFFVFLFSITIIFDVVMCAIAIMTRQELDELKAKLGLHKA